jgi:hypothetical protein
MLNLEPAEQLGCIVTTPSARAKVSRKDIATALHRHFQSVRGELSGAIRRHAKRTSLEGCRMLTAHRATNGIQFWIISESGHTLTRVMLPDDFRRSQDLAERPD